MASTHRSDATRSMSLGRLGVTVLLAGSAIVIAVLGLRTTPAGAGDEPPLRPAVPLWSVRRLPHHLADTVGAMRLPQEVDAALAGTDACFVLRESGRLAFAREPQRSLIPASTQKLLVAVAALHVLGPDHRFETRVVASSPPAGGAVPRLWVVGGGDPVLMTAEYHAHLQTSPLSVGHPVTSLEALADSVVASGVRTIEGGIIGDASRHVGAPTVSTWKPSYISDHNVSYLSALTVDGGWSEHDPARVTAPDPAVEAAAELGRLLEARGVVTGTEPAAGTAPGEATLLARVESPPLSAIVEAMIRESDNLIAEILTREIGLARRGVGDTPDGTAALVDALAELGIDVAGVALADGSGLDRGNRATCAAVLGALAQRRREGFEAVDVGLAVAGETGTLYRRFADTALEGVLRAKTGSLDGVTGLVGVIDRTPALQFAMLANGPFGSFDGGEIQQDVGLLMQEYPFTPDDPEVLAPPPPVARRPGPGPDDRGTSTASAAGSRR